MSSAKTTADLFRERGWGVGTKVTRNGVTCVVDHVGSDYVVLKTISNNMNAIIPFMQCDTLDWSLYRLTTPVPTDEEWRENVWPAMKRFRDNWTDKERARELAVFIDNLESQEKS